MNINGEIFLFPPKIQRQFEIKASLMLQFSIAKGKKHEENKRSEESKNFHYTSFNLQFSDHCFASTSMVELN
jgi:hypothetical protein